MNKNNFITLEQVELKELEEQIRLSFLERKLYKGSAEVINAIVERRPISKVYLVGSLDPWYETTITKCLIETQTPLQVVRLDKKYQRLVYDIIKDLELKPKLESKIEKKRTASRRFFLTRAFAI